MAVNYLDQTSFDAGENRLQGFVRETSMQLAQPTGEWDSSPRLSQSFLNIKSNIYTVVSIGARSIVPTVVLPHSCSTEQMILVCRQAGYEVSAAAGRGSHIKLR
jgi:hypothetical protein